MEVVAHHHQRGGQALHEHPLRERHRLFLRLCLIERDHHGGIDTGARQQFELLVEIGEQLRRALGPHHRRRVTIERDDDGSCARLFRSATNFGDHCLVAEVHAVVRADGEDRTLPRERLSREIGDDEHDAKR